MRRAAFHDRYGTRKGIRLHDCWLPQFSFNGIKVDWSLYLLLAFPAFTWASWNAQPSTIGTHLLNKQNAVCGPETTGLRLEQGGGNNDALSRLRGRSV
jgi:hypothetical protein